jgi:4-hydroxy-2-oxoglutarate aldolase
MTPEALTDHYRAVADASPVPVLLYNFTNVTGLNMTPDTVAALSAHPNIVGLKDSNGDIAQVAAVVSRVPASFTVLVGSAATLYPAMMMGASGGIVAVANVVPEVCVKLYDLVRAGKHDEARALQRRLTPLANAVTAGHGIAGLKVAMELAGYVGGGVRRPLRPAKPEVRDALQRLLEELTQ